MNLEWSDLQLIDAIHRGGTVRRAGEILGTHASTVTRRLERLERSLNTKLFVRTPGGLQLTLAGETANGYVAKIAQEVRRLTWSIEGEDSALTGRLEFAVPEILAPLVVELVTIFTTETPTVELAVIASDRAVDLGARDADMGLVITDAPPEHLLGRSLLDLTVAPFASGEYLEATDPSEHVWIGWDGTETDHGGMRLEIAPEMRVAHTSQSAALYFEMLLQGLGIGLLPEVVGMRLGLSRVPRLSSHVGPSVWLLWHPDLRDNARVRAFAGFLGESFAKIRTAH